MTVEGAIRVECQNHEQLKALFIRFCEQASELAGVTVLGCEWPSSPQEFWDEAA